MSYLRGAALGLDCLSDHRCLDTDAFLGLFYVAALCSLVAFVAGMRFLRSFFRSGRLRGHHVLMMIGLGAMAALFFFATHTFFVIRSCLLLPGGAAVDPRCYGDNWPFNQGTIAAWLFEGNKELLNQGVMNAWAFAGSFGLLIAFIVVMDFVRKLFITGGLWWQYALALLPLGALASVFVMTLDVDLPYKAWVDAWPQNGVGFYWSFFSLPVFEYVANIYQFQVLIVIGVCVVVAWLENEFLRCAVREPVWVGQRLINLRDISINRPG